MSNSIQSLYSWYRNTLRNPKYRWWIVLGTIAYLVSPFDIAPDFIPIIGQIDDVAVVTLLVAEISQMLIEYTKTRQNQTEVASAAGDETVDVDAATIK
jgi:uncharacterized membrane protein YkvA (DUF1232 family)